MKGSPDVITSLQEAVNMEASLAEVYGLNGAALKKGLGVKTGSELKGLGKQCKCYKKKLMKSLFLYDVAIEVAPDIATIAADIPTTLSELLSLEMDIITHYTDMMEIAWAAKDADVFHLAQHLVLRHKVGDRDFDGHVRYLEHEQKQLAALGLVNYITAHV